MHELSLAQSIVRTVEELSTTRNFNRVTKIRLSVGAFSGVATESLNFCFSEAARGTVLAEAELVLEETPLTVRCADCGKESMPALEEFCCKECASTQIRIVDGKDLKIIDLEVSHVP